MNKGVWGSAPTAGVPPLHPVQKSRRMAIFEEKALSLGTPDQSGRIYSIGYGNKTVIASKDDAERAQQAIADWKPVKRQVGEVIKIQSFRLEQVMATERRWPWQEFQTLLVKHPLMTVIFICSH
jgi:hypothetical protein